MISLCATLSTSYVAGSVRPALAPRARAATMVVDPASAVSTVGTLLAEGGAEEFTPYFYAQLGICGALYTYGQVLHSGALGEVDEPKEVGVVEGEVDIYRDSPLRYLGYANECGEAFRPLIPVEIVYFTYFAAIAYILADTVDKGKKGAAVEPLLGLLGATDTFLWQMLASVIFPSFCINRLVTLLFSLQEGGTLPEILTTGPAEFIPTVLGLLAIPLLIVPLDVLAHWTLNGSFRKVTGAILE